MSDRPSREEVERLFAAHAEQPTRRTRNALVEAHIGFANHVAKRFSNRGVADEDLRQVALLALVKAVDRFDPSVGAAFTSFAGRTIEGELKRHFRDTTWSVRVPRSLQERHLDVRRATDELHQKTGRSPTAKELAAHLEISVDEVVEALGAAAAYTAAPLVSSSGDDDDRDMPSDRSRSLADVDDRLDQAPDRLLVEQLLAELPAREREIVQLRFYDELTQSEIAERVGVSQMHVSRLLRRSITLMQGRAT